MQCLGTMLKCQSRGDHLSFITLTDGSKGFTQQPDIAPVEAARIRNVEMSSLTERLKAEYINLREPDEFLYDSPTVRMKLIEAIRHTNAQLVFTHYHEDYNLDHTTVSSLVRHCVMQACLPVLQTESTPLKESPAIFMVAPHGSFVFPATHFVDISALMDKKIALLALHRSQEVAMQQSIGAGFERLCHRQDGYWGQQAGCDYAEAFVPMRGRQTIKPYPVLP